MGTIHPLLTASMFYAPWKLIQPNVVIQGSAGEGEIRAWAANVCTCGQDCFGNGSK